MAWIYHQSTGDLFHDAEFAGTGYSGAGTTSAEGRNNPAMEGVQNEGPIPHGDWRIGKPIESPHMGPIAIPLEPVVPATALGRDGLFIHGNNLANNASEGCVILARGIRLEIVGSGDDDFTVVV